MDRAALYGISMIVSINFIDLFLGILGLPVSSSEAEVRKAYKQLAQHFHPQNNPKDPGARDKFQVFFPSIKKLDAK